MELNMISNAHLVAAQMAATSAKVQAGMDTLVAHWAAVLLLRVKANAQGRPGPRQITGDYLRSWGVQRLAQNKLAGTVWEVGTNAAQGRRVEYGFSGTDALGRDYDQPPYPHVGPAIDFVEPEFMAAADAYALALSRMAA